MGILTDVIIANPDEANAINAAGGGHARQWECLESKRVDTIRFWTLQQIVAGEPLSDVNAAGSFMSGDLITQRSDDGPWVFQIPVGLQSAIAALPQTAEASVAKAWAATEEFEGKQRGRESFISTIKIHFDKLAATALASVNSILRGCVTRSPPSGLNRRCDAELKV
jgi:hypothetical protein